MTETKPEAGYLTGKCLIAMPTMSDPRFARSIVYMCAHSAEGAMGLVVNRVFGEVTFKDLLQQLQIVPQGPTTDIRVHFGGPVEKGRGFVLHTLDQRYEGSTEVADGIAVTGTLDVMHELAAGRGPRRRLFALGYAGWAPGQLDAEIQQNAWLHCIADTELLFDLDVDRKWDRALAKLGVHPSLLSAHAGHA